MLNTMPAKNRFKLTPNALNDLKQIARFTQNKWGKQKRSVYLTALNNRFIWLSHNPDIGYSREDIKPNYLSYPEGKHVIFYRKGKNFIEIIGILHQNMDFGLHL